ncbi:MAG: UDP-N-acetylglucosamine 2-epimerase (non-hydrolyzing) [Chitinophagales bacterium]|nr:UDP-N-acetylglucosamine 2-epimerase (non-hydrolyzing) [Chitinophagales bacterium]HAE14056.1 UDP-N-acetylglucosamine 2-epimerase (non-hydrolyzing) [Bacteroidota bacterium]MCB9021314.1 UDP-N-acetylglucosamine 2-epimerase (non-hydrolyzing) [Chitinophagales bacterium]HPE97821.1 UDP-N-acetylglucosamine 2-epimerase (non-hydrolyzing) [Chitinophagales bacterium]HQU39036.1 UDP-N-acetylglucosamine 2-epimerase (non-hydrolyzing) [Chitinophagales bacterium]
MNQVNIDLIAGARPNFMKIAPIIRALQEAEKNGSKLQYRLVHTGQHYDRNMSDQFFEQLGIPEPDVNLGSGSGTQAEQTARIMMAYEKLLMEQPADLCLVVGDVTSTLACSVAAKKLGIKVAHVEAGIRSYDLTMPEEINRMVTDSITDYFFTTSEVANAYLRRTGVEQDRIFFVGNTMIDTLLHHRKDFRKPEIWDEAGLEQGKYIVMTLHRPSNVDEESTLIDLIRTIIDHSRNLPLVFPIHPRTRKVLEHSGLDHPRLLQVDPLGYLEFNYLVERAAAVITDSGGITEETTVMGVPCMTLRANTERPETIDIGTNELLGTNPDAIPASMEKLFSGEWKKGSIPPLWDGHTAERIVEHLENIFQ